MTADALSILSSIAEEKVFGKSNQVFEKGDQGSSLYIIIDGSIRIHDAYDVQNLGGILFVCFVKKLLVLPRPLVATWNLNSIHMLGLSYPPIQEEVRQRIVPIF